MILQPAAFGSTRVCISDGDDILPAARASDFLKMIDVAGAIVASHDRAGGSLIQYNYFGELI